MSSLSLFDRVKAVFSSRGLHDGADTASTAAQAVRFFANPGPDCEAPLPDNEANELSARARVIAFYLPQFHRFPENDEWWGAGFTEWRNVARATPRYQGHYQPRIPADLGCYDLSNPSVIIEQARLAQRSGIEAFCFYYYWFNGKRLMEKPLDLFAESEMPIDFCLMWANENWTRTWDGLDNEVLIRQDYHREDEALFIEDTARYMANPKYLQVAGRPVFIIYRASLLPEPRETLARWRTLWEEKLSVRPWLFMAQSFDDHDPRLYGLDGAVEFPPHKICEGLGNLRPTTKLFDKDFSGLVRDYSAVVNQSLNLPRPDFPEIKTVSPSWDNDARRQERGTSWFGASPGEYRRWLSGAIAHAKEHPFAGEPLVFINAWNEWAEGAYLEPDVHFGHAMLNATKRAVYGLHPDKNDTPILLLGHDAHRHGSQYLLLNIAKTLTEYYPLSVHIVLKDGGDLMPDYQHIARTTILGTDLLNEHLLGHGVALHEYRAAIVNTTVSGDQLPAIKRAGVPSIALVHELPMLIRDYKLQGNVADIAHHSDVTVFPAEMVQRGFESFGHSIKGKSVIKPQGTYLAVERNEDSRRRMREELGITEDDILIVNVGYADFRKGFDLFVETAQLAMSIQPTWHFAWVGELNSDMREWVHKARGNAELRRHLHLPGFIAGNTDHFSAADALLLTSREDPYPTVVLEALEAGLPFVGYLECSGLDVLGKRFGAMVPKGDLAETVNALQELIAADTEEKQQSRTDYIREHCQIEHYCEELLTLAGLRYRAPVEGGTGALPK